MNEEDSVRRNEQLKGADALLVRYFTRLKAEDIDGLPQLKYIGASSSSLDQIDLDYAKKKGVLVKNIAGYSNNSVAEFVLGALLAQIRHLPQALKKVSQNDFNVYPNYRGWELQGKTFGILGLGCIGKRVAELMMALGMKVQYHSRERKLEYEERGVAYVEKQTLFESSDVIGVFMEFNSDTKESIQKSDLNFISEGGVLISVAHTGVFNFPDLIEALKKDSFSFIQTYFSTLPSEHRDVLKAFSNVTLYPSIAVQTQETKRRMQERMILNLKDLKTG